MKLQPFSFEIRYRPGSKNSNADAFSKLMEDQDDIPRPSVTQKGGGGRCHEQIPDIDKRHCYLQQGYC